MTPQSPPLLRSVLLEDGDGGRFSTFEPLPSATDLAGSGLSWPTAITLVVLMICVTLIVLVVIGTVTKTWRQQQGLGTNPYTRVTPYGGKRGEVRATNGND